VTPGHYSREGPNPALCSMHRLPAFAGMTAAMANGKRQSGKLLLTKSSGFLTKIQMQHIQVDVKLTHAVADLGWDPNSARRPNLASQRHPELGSDPNSAGHRSPSNGRVKTASFENEQTRTSSLIQMGSQLAASDQLYECSTSTSQFNYLS